MENRIKESMSLIERVVADSKSPSIMWSGGKDSMVLLHLIRHKYGNIPFPVIFHREPFFPRKFAFHHQVEEAWNFVTIDYAPHETELQKSNGTLEIVRKYQIGPNKACRCPVSHYEGTMKKGEYLCGLSDLFRRPTGSFSYPWDATFIGHKSCDTDAFFGGEIPLHLDMKMNVGAPNLAFPLRHWTHDDIWDYIEEKEVPCDVLRYDAETRTEREDKTHNSDWYQCCVRCLDPDGPPVVQCPKLDMQVDNISDQFSYSGGPELVYFGDKSDAPTI